MRKGLLSLTLLFLLLLTFSAIAGGQDQSSDVTSDTPNLSDTSVDYLRNAWGIQGAITTNGNISTGVVNYGQHHYISNM